MESWLFVEHPDTHSYVQTHTQTHTYVHIYGGRTQLANDRKHEYMLMSLQFGRNLFPRVQNADGKGNSLSEWLQRDEKHLESDRGDLWWCTCSGENGGCILETIIWCIRRGNNYQTESLCFLKESFLSCYLTYFGSCFNVAPYRTAAETSRRYNIKILLSLTLPTKRKNLWRLTLRQQREVFNCYTYDHFSLVCFE